MPISERAKQFAPFSPLSGLGRALAEIEKERVDLIDRCEEMQEKIDRILHRLRESDRVCITHYDREQRQYRTVTDRFVRIDPVTKILHLQKNDIDLSDLYEIRILKDTD